ncbi:CRISPR-associated protein Cas1 [Natranaerovirga hydrolytica]|uniref:CRISPR-associated endonuclease Cas1 n=1 Tax=Natranaerovirga hydrolytica TaxID=680378 RepID=A0A4R1N175_9FIRM|nr:type I-B CRISPR-associated endonuclease Cas1b [Natranaerovirga hydrolytica]TCK98662.1 CRISPR-associated protein Cas1 [Natranaerovirga hydrolytica]
MGKTKYIFSVGELKRQDNSLCYRKEGTYASPNHIPIEQIRELYLMNEVSINTKLLDYLSRMGIVVHFFNYYGHYSGTFYPKEYLISGKLKINQAIAYTDPRRYQIAKAIVNGIAINMREVLYHYYRHDKKMLKDFLDYCQSVESLLEKQNHIKHILRVEGSLWARFYETFKHFLKEDFIMSKRVKRPPDNPINALISFGNSMLYTKTITMIYHTHLDQSISYLHEPSESRFSLSLDLSEVFKPIIVYKTIFELVNNKKILLAKHFDKKLNYCLLNEQGKQIFIKAFEERLAKTFKHPVLNRNVSLETAIKLDGYKLIKYLMEDKPFEPFQLKV